MSEPQKKTTVRSAAAAEVSAEQLFSLLVARYSARAFLSEPLGSHRIEFLLKCAALAPSWCNAQPWKVHVISGERLDRLRTALLEVSRGRDDEPDIPFITHYPEPYSVRKRAADDELQAARRLSSSDYAGIVDAVRGNWRFFNAPQALFLTVHRMLAPYALLDAGCFLQSFLLACTADGLGACAQAALARYPEVLRRHMDFQQDELIVCGVSFGLVDPAAPTNQCRTDRAPIHEVISIYGTVGGGS